MDNLDLAYKCVKLSTSLFTFSILYMWFVKPLLNNTGLEGLNDFFIALPFLFAGIISSVGFVFAMIGSQYGQRNAKKRFFGIYGNFLFAFMLMAMIFIMITEFREL